MAQHLLGLFFVLSDTHCLRLSNDVNPMLWVAFYFLHQISSVSCSRFLTHTVTQPDSFWFTQVKFVGLRFHNSFYFNNYFSDIFALGFAQLRRQFSAVWWATVILYVDFFTIRAYIFTLTDICRKKWTQAACCHGSRVQTWEQSILMVGLHPGPGFDGRAGQPN